MYFAIPLLLIVLSLLAAALIMNRRRVGHALAMGAWDVMVLAVTGGTGAESFNVQDSGAAVTLALPSAASTTVTSTGFDLGETTALAVTDGKWEFLLTAPALTTTMLPNGDTMTYNIVAADNAALSTNPTTLVAGAIVQTGAGGVGAALAKYRYRLPSVSQRYIGITIVSGSGVTNSSTLSATLAALF